jgi:hypothetical protein
VYLVLVMMQKYNESTKLHVGSRFQNPNDPTSTIPNASAVVSFMLSDDRRISLRIRLRLPIVCIT